MEREAAVEGDEGLRGRRRLHASLSFLGMVRLDGDLDPETGETLLTALQAVLDAKARSDTPEDRSPRSAGPTRSARSAGSGWTDRIGRPSPASVRT